MTFLQVFILSLIEGLTEFLPISSTGHLIIVQNWIGLADNHFTTQFNIIIQFGAILSVLVVYWRKFVKIDIQFYFKLFLAFLPAAFIGLLVKDKIDALLESVEVVAWALIFGGIILIYVDKKLEKGTKILHSLSALEYLKIGFFQCLAFIPGISRSGSSIVGGMLIGLTKKEAAEFSFFLAVPTLAAASFYKFIKIAPSIEAEGIQILAQGFVLSFIFAFLAIRVFIHLVAKSGFFWFGVYRIAIGGLVLIIS